MKTRLLILTVFVGLLANCAPQAAGKVPIGQTDFYLAGCSTKHSHCSEMIGTANASEAANQNVALGPLVPCQNYNPTMNVNGACAAPDNINRSPDNVNR